MMTETMAHRIKSTDNLSAHSAPADYSRQREEVGAISPHPFGVPNDDHFGHHPRGRAMAKASNNGRNLGRRSTSLSPESSWSSRSSSHHSMSSRASAASSTASRLSSSSYALSVNSSGSTLAFPRYQTGSPMLLLTAQDRPIMPPVKPKSLSPAAQVPRGLPVSADKLPQMVLQYEKLIRDAVGEYVALSLKIGPEVQRQSTMVHDLFVVQRDFLLSSCRNRVPSAGSGPLQSEKIQDIRRHCSQMRNSCAHPSHLSFVADTIGVMAWIADRQRPGRFIRRVYDEGKHHIKEIKKSKSSMQAIHTDWIKAWQEVILDLEAFVNDWHPRGIVWGRN